MRNEKGFSLTEVLIALAILGIIGVGFLGGLATSSKALFTADERATAESLARSQMEYVKNQTYITAATYDPGVPGSGEVIYQKITGVPDGYTIWSVNRAGSTVTDIIGVPWDTDPLVNQPAATDAGIQKITVVVQHHGNDVITLEDYKVDR